MWRNASSCVLLVAAALASVTGQSVGPGTGARDVLITLPVQIDGSLKDLQLMRGESIEDAAIAFARNHGLLANSDAPRVRHVIDQLSGLLQGRMDEMQASQPAKPTVQISMPLTINGVTRELQKMEGETPEAAAERFVYDGGYTMDAMRELYPQLVNLLLQKMEELKPPQKELFSFTLTIDGREAIARHFEGGDSMEEARETLRGIGMTESAIVERIAPQIANEINRRVTANEASQETSQPQPQAVQAQPSPLKELFSIPLTVNERATILVHYDGYTSQESATRYMNENGLTGSDSVDGIMGQLIQIIDTRVTEIANEQAQQEAAVRAAKEKAEMEEAARRAADEDAARNAAAAVREPTVRLSINVGGDRPATLEYFEGDSVERTVELFLTNVGVQPGQVFNQNVEALTGAIHQEMKAVLAQRQLNAADSASTANAQPEMQPEPFVALPVTLSGRVFDLVYFEGEQPATVANAFCVEKHEIIRSELGLQFDGDQLLECKNLLEKTLRNLIVQKQRQLEEQSVRQQEQPPTASETQATVTEDAPRPREENQPAVPPSQGEYLLSLDIDIDGQNVPLHVHQNDVPEEIARQFCEQHKVDLANVRPLVEAINEQLAQLK